MNELVALTLVTRKDAPYAVDTLRKKVQRGELPHVRVGRRIFIEREVLERLRRGIRIPAGLPFRGGAGAGER